MVKRNKKGKGRKARKGFFCKGRKQEKRGKKQGKREKIQLAQKKEKESRDAADQLVLFAGIVSIANRDHLLIR